MSFFKSSIFYIILHLLSKTAAINVALNKLAAYCNGEPSFNKMVDGIKTLTNFERYTEPCISKSFVKVVLNGKHVVHYVIVFDGEGNDDGQLDFFIVRLSESSEAVFCSEYPGTANFPEKSRGLRVNCENRQEMYSNVIIYSRKNIGFAITEIEVHSLVKPEENALIPFGCFSSLGSKDLNMKYDLASCVLMCLREKFIFAGIENNTICDCTNKLNKNEEIPMTNCDVPCAHESSQKYCGGTKSYSVYLIALLLPYYIGCSSTSADLISNSVGNGDMTVAKCLHLCEHQRYAFLQSGDYCICQDSVDKSGISRTGVGCTTKCTGDINIACGGNEMASVFSTCSTDSITLGCSDLFKCEGSYDMYGACGGVCKYGFLGDHCLERTETFSPSTCLSKNPCSDLPNTICILSEGKEKCICMKGYTKGRGEECQDIDECKNEPCDSLTTDCINLNGSYVCQCKAGFIKLNDDICLRNETANNDFNVTNYLIFLIPMISLLLTMMWVCLNEPFSTESPSISSHTSRMSAGSIW